MKNFERQLNTKFVFPVNILYIDVYQLCRHWIMMVYAAQNKISDCSCYTEYIILYSRHDEYHEKKDSARGMYITGRNQACGWR